MVLAKVVFEKSLVDFFDQGEETSILGVEGQIREGVPRRGHTDPVEQTPNECLTHLRRVIVHCLEVEATHAHKSTVIIGHFEVEFPGGLRCVKCPVPAIHY